MPTFICYLNWTDEGAKNHKETGKRAQNAKALAEKLGGRLLSAYVTTGPYDVVGTLDMPDGDAMAKFVIALSAQGTVRTTTARAYSPEEFGKLAVAAAAL